MGSTTADAARRYLVRTLTALMVGDGAPVDDAETAATAEVEALTDSEALTAASWGGVSHYVMRGEDQ